MKGFDLYEQWRSCVFEVSGFIATHWDSLEIWERRAWEELSERVDERTRDPDSSDWSQPQTR